VSLQGATVAPGSVGFRAPAEAPGAGKHVLVVDNYDSFTYNLVQGLAELGARLTVWRNDAFTVADVEELAPHGVVISPGPCTPDDAGMSVELVRSLAPKLPILGVCLGHQAIGAAFGGRVVRAGRVMHGKTSRVHHDGTGIFSGRPQPLTAGRYHSLVLEDAPPGLVVNAWTEDGDERVIMGVRHETYPVWGVQFHPESILTQDGAAMLGTFLSSLGGG
jgi:anthranilate synthase component 2